MGPGDGKLGNLPRNKGFVRREVVWSQTHKNFRDISPRGELMNPFTLQYSCGKSICDG
jgi:hypothetical protein